MNSGLKECVALAVDGREKGLCSGDNRETDDCVGLRLSIQNSLKTTECKIHSPPICHRYGHKQHHQSKWVAVSSGHLAIFANCVRDAYPLNDRGDLSIALEDDAFVAFLRTVDDGSTTYGMAQGTILLNLLKGERLSSTLKNSDIGKKLDKRLLQEIIESAETPTPIDLSEDIAQTEESINLAIGNDFLVNKSVDDNSKEAPHQRSLAALSSGSYQWVLPKTKTATTKEDESNNNRSNVHIRVIKNNLYSLNLDQSLFDRVSSAYIRLSPDLLSMNEYIKFIPKKPPKDVKELIERGRPANL
ncbi:MAG: hypothetical protein M9962_03650 [Oligoflexia bacterium]|nr:hypothetical protein [Oligoflexia bacterium]